MNPVFNANCGFKFNLCQFRVVTLLLGLLILHDLLNKHILTGIAFWSVSLAWSGHLHNSVCLFDIGSDYDKLFK